MADNPDYFWEGIDYPPTLGEDMLLLIEALKSDRQLPPMFRSDHTQEIYYCIEMAYPDQWLYIDRYDGGFRVVIKEEQVLGTNWTSASNYNFKQISEVILPDIETIIKHIQQYDLYALYHGHR